jgi:TatD DNase family protein
LDKAIEGIDLEHLVLETDSPYLAPVPHRGKRNESFFIIDIAKKLAELKGVGIAKVAEITTENSRKIFSI